MLLPGRQLAAELADDTLNFQLPILQASAV
jgi:hypothetical protein